MAFVSSFIPAFARPAAATAAACSTSAVRAPMRMAEKSPSVPFMDAPDALSRDMPGYVGFGKFFYNPPPPHPHYLSRNHSR